MGVVSTNLIFLINNNFAKFMTRSVKSEISDSHDKSSHKNVIPFMPSLFVHDKKLSESLVWASSILMSKGKSVLRSEYETIAAK